ncbi:MAG: hypothetical protein KJ634_12400 [Gammaproteobacteria bacterium]|nr:hypothetical protein [Gammaproteobacteria bacterium]MBU1416414.1 hypothetical protein [Gammaproteobacteria bacterium]
MNEPTFAKAPKILPWLAHKAGIDDRRAETLWHAALRHAAHVHTPDAPDYWQTAMDRLLELINTESQRQDAASFGWRPWARSLANIWTVRMDVLDEIALAPIRAWRILGQFTPRIH